MKKIVIIGLMVLGLLHATRVAAQDQELQQLALNIEKLAQFKQILQDMKKGYEILSNGYKSVKDLSQGNFNLHKTFLDALMQVSPSVRKYKRISDIISNQLMIVKEYKAAFDRFKKSGSFNAEELDYLSNVYHNLFEQSLKSIDELTIVLTANTLRMSDEERLASIDTIFAEMQQKLLFLRSFNNSTAILAMQRAKEHQDVNSMRRMYTLKN